MRLAWATDIHLNFIDAAAVGRFVDALAAPEPDAVLLAGDIAEADSLENYLVAVAGVLERPIYFVLGNHDFYRGSITEVRAMAERLSRESPWLRWLPAAGVVELSPRTALVGHDGWGDGRLGDPLGSRVALNDWIAIRGAAGLPRPLRLERLRTLGDEAAAYLARVLPAALERYPEVIVLTHVPPFREACWHAGAISNDDWLPWFTCDAVGRVLAAAARPGRRIRVLCGHTHGGGVARPLPGLEVVTGAAKYGNPAPQEPFEVP